LRWPFTFAYAGLAVGALAAYGLTIAGVGVAALALVSTIVMHRMRLVADASGVTVVNLGRRRHVGWGEISDFRRGRIASSTCLDICRRDLSRIHAWAVTATTAGAYSESEVFEIAVNLRRLLLLATGEVEADLRLPADYEETVTEPNVSPAPWPEAAVYRANVIGLPFQEKTLLDGSARQSFRRSE
jgi:PH (Pleckstrin Homology) domain-containing protein